MAKAHIFGFVKIGQKLFDKCLNLTKVYSCSSTPPEKINPSSIINIFTNGASSHDKQVNVEVPSDYSGNPFAEGKDKVVNTITIDTVTIKTSLTISGSGVIDKNMFDANYKCSYMSSDTTDITFVGDGNFDLTDKIGFHACKNLVSVIFSNTGNQPTAFRSESFSRCSSLTTFVLPNSLKQLGIKAFAYTNISEIAIPHCDFINHDCFAFCSNLKRFSLLATSILFEYAAFYECRSLVSFYYCGKYVPQHNDNSMPYMQFGLLENGKNVTNPNSYANSLRILGVILHGVT